VNFVVSDGKLMQIVNLINYPNPFTENTRLFFEHNHPSEVLKVQLMIYDMAGHQVRHIETSFTPSGSHSNEISWDGTSDSGARLPSGVYPCRMILSTESGIQGTAYQKMVIVR
jgi:flagellar hook assembly protein FlgD